MTFLDAYALVALVADEPAAEEVEALLREGGTHIVIVNLAEAIDITQRVHGIAAGAVRVAIEPLLLGNVLSAAVSDEPHAWLAAEIRAAHYHRTDSPLSMTDCFLLAHAVTEERSIATSDPAVASAAAALGVAVIGLPDSSGKHP